MKRLKTLSIILLVFAGRMYATPIVSGASGDWNNPATWLGGVTPAAGDIVTIANGHTVTVTANASCAAVIIGNGLLDQSATLTFGSAISLTVTGNITITPPLTGSVDNTLDVNAGIVSCASLVTTNSSINSARCIVSIGTGTLTCNNTFLMANNVLRNQLIFSGAGLLQLAANGSTIADAQFTAGTGTIEYKGTGGQVVLGLSYYNLKCSGAGYKYLTANTVLAGDLIITERLCWMYR
jgi:hypothetical protein